MLEEFFSRNAARPFLIDVQSGSLTYQDVWTKVGIVASALAKAGVSPQQRVVISLAPSVFFLICVLACARGRFIACPVDNKLPQQRLLNYKTAINAAFEIDERTLSRLNEVKPENDVDYKSEPTDQFLMLLSSGTTADIKVIVLGLQQMIESAQSFAALSNVNQSSRFAHNLPMHYMAGIFNLLFVPLTAGASVFVDPYGGPQKLTKYWDDSLENGVNCAVITPTIAASLTKLERNADSISERLASFQMIVSTSSLLFPTIRESFERVYRKKLYSCYGVTEVGGSITLNQDVRPDAPYCVGGHDSKVQVKIQVHEEVKKVLIKTPFMMIGFLKDNKMIAGVDRKDGFFDTGDIGDYKNGLLTITGRYKDSVKKGGELIFLTDIENIALTCSEVREAAAVGREDEYWGNKIILYIVSANADQGLNMKKRIYGYLGERLRKIEMPDEIVMIDEIPKTVIGKQIKRLLP